MISLMNHINTDKENPFLALAFSGRDELMGYLYNNQIDILLVDEKLYTEMCMELRKQRCVVLSRKRTQGMTDLTGGLRCSDRIAESMVAGTGNICKENICKNDMEDIQAGGQITAPGVLFKYSRVGDIVQALMKYMDLEMPERSRQLFRSYGVISPIGRCGKTNLAINLCMNDEVRGGLYIGMEDFSSFEDGEDVVSNVIYLVKTRSAGFIEYIETHTVKLENYSVLGYMRSYLDALELTRGDAEWMMEQLKLWGRYTTVVFDIGQAVLKDLSVLSALDIVVVPELPDEQSQDKIRTFEKILEAEELGKIVRRMKKVRVPNAVPGSAEMLRFIESQVVDKW